MLAADGRKGLLKHDGGAALLEFTLVAWFFFITIFGVIEFSLYFWQINAISKGLQAALRYAVVSTPVTGDWSTLLQPTTTPDPPWVVCRSQGLGTATCSPSTNAANPGVMDCIVKQIRAFAPFVDPTNVVVEYQPNSLGVSNFQAPTVRIRLDNLRFMTIFLGFMGGATLNNLENTMTAEDASSFAPGGSGTKYCVE